MRKRIKFLLLTSLPFTVLPSVIWFGVLAYVQGRPYHLLAGILFLWSPVIWLVFITGLIMTIINVIITNSYIRRYRPKNPINGWIIVGLLSLYIVYSLVTLYIYVLRPMFS